MSTMREKFEEIYAKDKWGNGSGEGSALKFVSGYVRFLQEFIAEHRIQSVVDLGCGDWQFSRHMDWSGVQYHGFDLVRSVIEQNQVRYGSANVQFSVFSGNFQDLPPAGLLIVKDVLQHWSNESVAAFLPHLKRYPMALVTNCVNPRGITVNKQIADGGFRCLDLRRAPFSVAAEEVFSFSKPRTLASLLSLSRFWKKSVLLVRNSPA